MKYKVNLWDIETAHQGVAQERGHEVSRCKKNREMGHIMGRTIVEGS